MRGTVESMDIRYWGSDWGGTVTVRLDKAGGVVIINLGWQPGAVPWKVGDVVDVAVTVRPSAMNGDVLVTLEPCRVEPA